MKKLGLFLLICLWLLVTVLLVVLKLAGVVTWSWSAVTSPIWLAWMGLTAYSLYLYYALRPRGR